MRILGGCFVVCSRITSFSLTRCFIRNNIKTQIYIYFLIKMVACLTNINFVIEIKQRYGEQLKSHYIQSIGK